jgi:hypothetical protein
MVRSASRGGLSFSISRTTSWGLTFMFDEPRLKARPGLGNAFGPEPWLRFIFEYDPVAIALCIRRRNLSGK